MKIDFEPDFEEVVIDFEPDEVPLDASDQIGTSAPAGPTLTADAPGIGDDLTNVGNAFLRGVQNVKQATAATGVSNAMGAASDVATAQKELADFDAFLAQPENQLTAHANPVVKATWDDQRKRLESRVAEFQGEAAFRTGQVPSSIGNIVEAEQAKKSLPATGGLQEFYEGEDWLGALARNPVEVVSGLVAESLPLMAPGLAATVVSGPAGGMAATGASSFATENSLGILQSFQKAGADLSDPESVKSFFSDPEKLATARQYAASRGIPIAIFDAASAGLAGKIAGPALKRGGKALVTAASGGELAMQAALGASGEAAGQLITEGKINDPRSVVAEAVAELGTGPVEVYGALRNNARLQAERDAAAARLRDAEMPVTAQVLESLPTEQIAVSAPPSAEVSTIALNEQFTRIEDGSRATVLRAENGSVTYRYPGDSQEITLTEQQFSELFRPGVDPDVELPALPPPPETLHVDLDGPLSPIPNNEATSAPESQIPTETPTSVSGTADPELLEESGEQAGTEGSSTEPPVANAYQPGARVIHNGVERRIHSVEQHPQDPDRTIVSFADDPNKFVFIEDLQEAKARAATADLSNAAPTATPSVPPSPEPTAAPEEVLPPALQAPVPSIVSQPVEEQESNAETTPYDEGRDEVDVVPYMRPADPNRPRPGGETIDLPDIFPFKGRFPRSAWPSDEVIQQKIAKDEREAVDIDQIELPAMTKTTPLQGQVDKGIAEYYRDNPSTEPVVLVEEDGALFPISGYHRLAGAKMRGASTISAIVIRAEDNQPAVAAKLLVEPPAPPATPAPEPSLRPQQSPTGIRNAIVDQERSERGLPPRMAPARKAFGVTWDQAMAQIDRNPQTGPDLVTELAAKSRPVTDVENAILTHEKLVRRHEFDRAIEDQNNAKDEAAQMDAAARLDRARDAFDAVTKVTAAVGTENARGLASRKILVTDDFSLAEMEATVRSTENNGKPLSAARAAEVKALHDKIAAAEKKIAELEERERNAAAQHTFQSLLKELADEAREQSKQGKKLTDFFEEQAKKARERIRARRGRVMTTIDPLNVAGLIDETIIGANYIAKGITKLTEWSQRMISDIGESIRPVLNELFAQSQQYHDANATLFKGSGRKGVKKKPTAPAEVLASATIGEQLDPKLVFDLARAHVRAGVIGMEKVMAAVHADLAPKFGGLSIRDVRDAFSGYGKVVYPSKADDLVKLREYKALARLTSQLEDALRGIAPLKTGPQRDRATERVRDLQKRVRAAMEAAGIQASTPEQQLKTSLDAVKTRLQNEIEELDTAIASRTPRATNNRTLVYDTEAEALKARRDEKKRQYDELFPPQPITNEERVKRALKQLDRSIAEEDNLLKQGIFRRLPRVSQTPVTPEIENRRMELDAMRELRRELYAAANPGKSAEQIALEAAMKAAERSIARYDEMLRTGNLRPAERRAKFNPTDELENLWMLRNAMGDAVAELRKDSIQRKSAEERARDQAIKALNKSIADIGRRIQEGDFSPTPRKVNRPEVQQVAELRNLRDKMRQTYHEMKKAQLPQRSPEEIQLARDKKAIATRTKKLQDKIAANDYTTPPKKDPVMDAEKERLMFEYAKAKEQFTKGVFEAKLKQRSIPRKIFDFGVETLNLSRAIMTSFDFSGVLRQGGFIVLGNPVRAAKSLVPMFRAFFSEKAQFAINDEIKKRVNAPLYKQSKLYISDPSDTTTLTKMEEAYASRWINKIPRWTIAGPIVRGSQRAYTTFLNKLRADSFDAMATTLAKEGKPTLDEAKAIASFINIATGRGVLPSAADQAAVGLNTVFFAPRYVLSRFQLLLNPLTGFSITGGTARVRKQVALEYAKYLIGVGVVYALAMAAQDDDDESIELDSTSTNFLKVRFGNTRLDPLSGIQQVTVFSAREGDALRRFFTQDYEDEPKYGSGGKELGRFVRTKLAPGPGALVNALFGKDVLGNKVTPASTARSLTVPISFGEIIETMEAQGIPKGQALALCALLGMGVQTYEERD